MLSINKLIFFINFVLVHSLAKEIYINLESLSFKQMERFWTNSGFSPIGNYTDFLLSKDTRLSLELMASLPNNGLKNVRIHWLLDLIQPSVNLKNVRTYDFEQLDSYIHFLVDNLNLNPAIEFMVSDPIYRNMTAIDWEDFVNQTMIRYLEKFGPKRVLNWNLETWNEPDLLHYNLMNFTLPEYLNYVYGIWNGLRSVERQYNLGYILKLRGPAGLFKQESKHKLCWGLLENCNNFFSKCPIDIITFHRKGSGLNAEDIFNGGIEIKKKISKSFPNLKNFQLGNSEADPISRWSEPRSWQADVRYAAILVKTVFDHWQGIYNNSFGNLAFISHDNAFLSYFPNNFKQRTLFARFQMNLSSPERTDYVHFIQKPVFSALGLLARMGDLSSSQVNVDSKNISYLITRNFEHKEFYACLIITSIVDTRENYSSLSNIKFKISNIANDSPLKYFIEYIEQNTTPDQVYLTFKEPPYPNSTVFASMRSVQNPQVYSEPIDIIGNYFVVNLKHNQPFIASIRICTQTVNLRFKNVRLNKISQLEIYIFWSNLFNINSDSRCVKTYQVFFKSTGGATFLEITGNSHIPFSNFFYYNSASVSGCYKVRTVDFWGNYGKFSKKKCTD